MRLYMNHDSFGDPSGQKVKKPLSNLANCTLRLSSLVETWTDFPPSLLLPKTVVFSAS